MLNDVLLAFHIKVVSSHPLTPVLADITGIAPDMVNKILALCDAPQNGRAIVFMKPVVEYLFVAYYQEKNIDEPALYVHLFDTLWSGIRKLSLTRPLLASTSVRGCLQTNPIYAFHFLTFPFKQSGATEQLKKHQTYYGLAAYLHLRINYWSDQIAVKKSQINMAQYRSHLGLAARKIIEKSAGVSSRRKLTHSPIQLAILGNRIKKSISTRTDIMFSSGDMSFVLDLLIRDSRDPSAHKFAKRSFTAKTRRWRSSGLAILQVENLNDYKKPKGSSPFFPSNYSEEPTKQVMLYQEKNDDILEMEGEYEADYKTDVAISIPASWEGSSWERVRRNKARVEAQLQLSIGQPWDDKCISFDGLRRVLKSLRSDSVEPDIKYIILSSLLMGTNENTIYATSIMSLPQEAHCDKVNLEDLASDKVWLDIERNSYWKVSVSTPVSNPNYYLISEFQVVQLPDIFHIGSLKVLSGNLFNKSSFNKTNAFLKELGNDGLTALSISRLRFSFKAYFINGAGLPPLYADYLAMTRSGILLSQHHYVTFPQAHLENEWHQMVNSFLKGIDTQGGMRETLTSMCYEPWREETTSATFVGASRTPKVNKMREHLNHLWEKFPHDKQALLQGSDLEWNYYMCYLYLFYALCTGQRPLRDPMPKQSNINIAVKLSHVSDKHNRVNQESRDIPLCDSLSQALVTHDEIHRSWLMMQRAKGYTLKGSLDSFLVIDSESNTLRQASVNVLDSLLEDTSQYYFYGIKNGCRHLLLSLLHWKGLPQEYLDYIAGHKHAGFEPTHICSPISSILFGKVLNAAIESSVVDVLQLKPPLQS